MNIYNSEAIFLSGESTRTLVSTLLFDKKSLSLRNDFISDVENNISFLDNGDIVVDVPDIEFVAADEYVPVKVAVATRRISIIMREVVSVSSCYTNVEVQNTLESNATLRSRYVINKKEEQWNTTKVA